ncbi:hypothetical protein FHL15_010032 [Xylaria flabelliformis]|uniref:Peptidase metallopeptidase domain-containing protein n=1 Tax=Xylaria flabelliformis TaxID=2512241 RepID=A0A553HMC5_9PEZI|nr:hypothetical protein FHL15_010032 [Xylaria flabelliformis]
MIHLTPPIWMSREAQFNRILNQVQFACILVLQPPLLHIIAPEAATETKNYRIVALPDSDKCLDAEIKGHPANIRSNSDFPSIQHAAELESSERGSFTIAADSAVESESLSSQSDETTSPTESELAFDKPTHNDGQERLWDEEHGRDDNSVVNYTLDPLSAAEPKLSELLCGVGASLAAPKNTQGLFTGNISHPNDLLGLDYEHDNRVCQNTVPSKELPYEKPNMTDELNPILHGTKFCITQDCTGSDICDLYLHRGRDCFIARWPLGSEIKYSIDYNSFDTRHDANYALNQLQFAAGLWNSHGIGVQFVYVEPNEHTEPNQSRIIFKLKYKSESVSRNKTVFASSFFPIDAERRRRPCKLHIFGASFDGQYRDDMWRTFIHEIAHILGGRHENAPERERHTPFVLCGERNDQSVLVGGREPSTVDLHLDDIKWFKYFMGYPEGSLFSDHDGQMIPIRDIVL